jgi:hypothetical protein
MAYFSDDPVADFNRYDRDQQRQLERLPVCEGHKCGQRIQDDIYFDIDGEILCEECMIRKYGRRTEDYNA